MLLTDLSNTIKKLWEKISFQKHFKAEICVTNRDLNNSSYPTRTEFNNCFIVNLYMRTTDLKATTG